MACIDLRYKVYSKPNKIKDEKHDTTTVAMALGDTVTENIINDEDEKPGSKLHMQYNINYNIYFIIAFRRSYSDRNYNRSFRRSRKRRMTDWTARFSSKFQK